MSNSGLIVFDKQRIAIELHWNGGRDSVEAFLEYCRLAEVPCAPLYVATVINNYMDNDGTTIYLHVLPDNYSESDALKTMSTDHGVYWVKDYEIVKRTYPHGVVKEQRSHDLDEFLHDIDSKQPAGRRLGAVLDAEEVPVSEIRVGDFVFMPRRFMRREARRPFAVVGIADDKFVNGKRRARAPYVAMFGSSGDYSNNPNNYIPGETVRRVRRLAW